MSTALLPYGQPLYWSFHERPEAWHIDPFHQYAKQLVFFGGGRFTHSTHFHDSSLYGNHGALTNMDPTTDWVRNLGRWALDFDYKATTGTHVAVGNPSVLNLNNNNGLTITCFYTSQQSSIFQCLVSKATSSVGAAHQRFYELGITNTRKLYFNASNGVFQHGYVAACMGATNSDAVGSSYHAAVTWDGTTGADCVKIWRNGIVDNTATATGEQSTISTSGKLYIAGNRYHPNSLVSDASIWNRVLSPSEISALADPSNVILSLGGSDLGLIVPDDLVYPVYLPSSVPAGAKPALWLGVCA